MNDLLIVKENDNVANRRKKQLPFSEDPRKIDKQPKQVMKLS
jgi:hypothetical protein